MPPDEVKTEGADPGKAKRSAAEVVPSFLAGIARSNSRVNLSNRRSKSTLEPDESPREGEALETSDAGHLPIGQRAAGLLTPETRPTPRTRSRSLSPEYNSETKGEPKFYIGKSQTGNDNLVPRAWTSTGTTRPSGPRRRSHQHTTRLQPQVDTADDYPKDRRGSQSSSREDIRVPSGENQTVNPPRKFVWIHVPFNNPVWVRKVFETLSVREERDYVDLFNSENWASRHARGRHSQYHASFLKPACGYTSLKANRPLGFHEARSDSGLTRGDSLVAKQHGQGCLYLYFPFLHFESYRKLIKRRDLIKRRTNQGRTRPIPREVAQETSMELQVIWEYLGHDPPINCRRTLDQYRYPSLHDTRARDDDQMLYKMTKERVVEGSGDATDNLTRPVPKFEGKAYTQRYSDEGLRDWDDDDDQDDLDSDFEDFDTDHSPDDNVLDGNVLMVDQLWLWVVDTSK